jgi:hypothetical protein
LLPHIIKYNAIIKIIPRYIFISLISILLVKKENKNNRMEIPANANLRIPKCVVPTINSPKKI